MTTRITDTHDPDITVTLDSGSHINASSATAMRRRLTMADAMNGSLPIG